MPKFNVHLYREMRLYYPGIEAPAEDAARLANLKSTDEAELIEDCDAATLAALVDVDGDAEYTNSRRIDFDPLTRAAPAVLNALKALVLAIRAGRDPAPLLSSADAAIAATQPPPTTPAA